VEGMKRARVCVMNNIKVDHRGIGLRSLSFVQNMDSWIENLNLWKKFWIFQMGGISLISEKLKNQFM